MRLPSLLKIALAGVAVASLPAHAWEPSKPIEFVVPAGTGGGADPMARFIEGVVAKNSLSKQPIIVVNKSGLSIFWANPLVGTIFGLAILLLLWPLWGTAIQSVRKREARAA